MAFVDFEQRGPIGVITMNRPEALNALNDQVLKDLDAVLDAAEANARRRPTTRCWCSSSPARAAPLWPGPTSAR